jgi:hypothetical protein
LDREDLVKNVGYSGWTYHINCDFNTNDNSVSEQEQLQLYRNHSGDHYCSACHRYVDDTHARRDPFFIEQRKEHYGHLSRLIFKPLSDIAINIQNEDTHDFATDILDRYTLRTNITDSEFYKKTNKHLKMGFRKPNLLKALDELANRIAEYNRQVGQIEPQLHHILEDVMGSINLTTGPNLQNLRSQLIRRLRYECRCLIQSRELHDLNRLDMGRPRSIRLETGGESEYNDTINQLNGSLRPNTQLLQHLRDLQNIYSGIDDNLQQLRTNVRAILTSMDNGTYDTTRGCCPTFLNLMDRYLFVL